MNKLIIFITLSLLVSCSGNRYTSARIHNIEADLWSVQDTIEQVVNIQDTSLLYQVSIFVSSMADDTNEIDILSNICYQEICTKIDTLKICLSHELHRTLIAKERKSRFLVMDSVKFTAEGEYRFRFSPTKDTKISSFGIYIYEK